ncbi:MAG: Alanine--tRNA ligase [Herbinix sp.]|jgi:alanyl-tRNA synthetase|nr:Alanine--tRNA ligase [Herbinix sp.]
MKVIELRRKYVEFFEERGHKVMASASLVPDNDVTVLFTTAGMHPLIPYLLGERHPFGKRLVNIQKCVRTGDIDEVGDGSHHTYFEMLGNWSLGDYFKKESITMSLEFLTEVLNIPMKNLSVTVFEGDAEVARDTETYHLWKQVGLTDSQIYYYGRKENWWGPVGLTGPCGPDTEIFYDNGNKKCCVTCGPSCSCGKYVEIWNNVFMEYNKNQDGSYSPLKQKNVDTGMGLERILRVVNGKENDYETELFYPIIEKVEELTGVKYGKENERIFRIVSDHMRAAVFILGDEKEVVPTNSEQGYILRRIIRRTIRYIKLLGNNENILVEIADKIIDMYDNAYPELGDHRTFILEKLDKEYQSFSKSLVEGLKKAEKYFKGVSETKILNGELAFRLFDTFGFPIEFTEELAQEKGYSVDVIGFELKFKEHQEKSRIGASGRFNKNVAN